MIISTHTSPRMHRKPDQLLPEEVVDQILIHLVTESSKCQLVPLLTLSRTHQATIERGLYRELILANSNQAAVQRIASALKASPHRGSFIESIEFEEEHQAGTEVRHSEFSTFLLPVMDILKSCQPCRVSIRAVRYHEEVWDFLQTDKITDLAVTNQVWDSDDHISRWAGIIRRSSTTLKTLHLSGLENDFDTTSSLFPQPSTYQFPALRCLRVFQWCYGNDDNVHSHTILDSRELSPLVTGIIECAGFEFEELYFDKTVSHHLVLDALLKKGDQLKRLGSLVLDQIPGTGLPVKGDLIVAQIDNNGQEEELIEPPPPQTLHTLASLSPKLEHLSIRGIPAEHLESVLRTFPDSLKSLRLWLGDENQQEALTQIVEAGQALPGIARLDVELRTNGRRRKGATAAARTCKAALTPLQKLRDACKRQCLELNIVEPLRHLYHSYDLKAVG